MKSSAVKHALVCLTLVVVLSLCLVCITSCVFKPSVVPPTTDDPSDGNATTDGNTNNPGGETTNPGGETTNPGDGSTDENPPASVTYTVTFYTMEGEVHSAKVAENGFAIFPATPVYEGYDFDGWYTDYDIWQNAFTAHTAVTADISVYAKHTLHEYLITYLGHDGLSHSNPLSYFMNTDDIVLQAPENIPGYTFEGWYNGSEPIDSVLSGSHGDLTLTAKLTPITYTITYVGTKDVTNENPETYTIESPAITFAPLACDGYEFSGWSTTGVPTGSIGDVTVTAAWSLATYSIQYEDLRAATHDNPSTYTIESDRILLSAPTELSEYVFLGWYIGETAVEDIPAHTFGDIRIEARWETPALGDIIYDTTKTELKVGEVLSAELFGASCEDIKGNAATVTVTSDLPLSAGNTVNITITATRADRTKSVVIQRVKVYGTPTITASSDAIRPNTDLNAFFTAKDSFGKRQETIITHGVLTEGTYADIKVATEDHLGNKAEQTFTVAVYYLYFDFEPLSGGTYALALYTGTRETVVVPAEFFGGKVTKVNASVFADCTQLKTLTLPDSITSIGKNVLSGCANLTRLTVPFMGAFSGDTTNGYLAYFFGGTKYSQNETVVPATLTAVNVLGGPVGEYAFYCCGNIRNVTLGDEVSAVGAYSFYECERLDHIVIPDKVTVIGRDAFYGCVRLRTVSLGKNVMTIGSYAFQDCVGLLSITIPGSVTSIGTSAFKNCYRLIEVHNNSTLDIVAGKSTNGYVGYYAQYVDRTVRLTSYEGYTFWSDGVDTYLMCYDGTDPDLELPITYKGSPYGIYQYAFSYRDDLLSIVMPTTAVSLGIDCLIGCDYLTRLELPYLGTTPDAEDTIDLGELFGNTGMQSNSYVPDTLEYVSIMAGWLGGGCMESCAGLKTVVIGDDVQTDGNNIFEGCKKLTSVTLGRGIQTIPDEMFKSCTALKTLSVPGTVKIIGTSAFEGCSALTSVTLGSGVTTIENSAFSECSKLTSLYIPSTVVNVGRFVFDGCDSLTYTTYNGGQYLSAGGNSYHILVASTDKTVTSFTIHDRTVVIAGRAFYYHKSLSSIVIPDGVKGIGTNAFEYCEALSSVTIGSSVQIIDTYAFSYCKALKVITYHGKTTQWLAITCGSNWANSTGTFTVACSDGTLSKSDVK